jgi:hypothetical protein
MNMKNFQKIEHFQICAFFKFKHFLNLQLFSNVETKLKRKRNKRKHIRQNKKNVKKRRWVKPMTRLGCAGLGNGQRDRRIVKAVES